jgi:hypothetical protein
MMSQLTLYNGPDRLALHPGTAARATPPSPIGWERGWVGGLRERSPNRPNSRIWRLTESPQMQRREACPKLQPDPFESSSRLGSPFAVPVEVGGAPQI